VAPSQDHHNQTAKEPAAITAAAIGSCRGRITVPLWLPAGRAQRQAA
jgi:hypothetical protein